MPHHTPDEIRALANAADVSPPTLNRYLLGLAVRPRIRARIERALAEMSEPRPSSPPPSGRAAA